MTERYLTGRVALVTGGASGMGRAMALALAHAGARVAIGSLLQHDTPAERHAGELAYLPSAQELEKTVLELQQYDTLALAMGLDVTSSDSVAAFYHATVETLGPVDILANAAGITAEHPVCGHSEALWKKVLDVNLHGTFRTIALCLPAMIQQGWGRIINIASTAASVGSPTSAAYSASKAGVVGFTRAVALEGAEHGVTCNSISPGWVETSFGTDWMGHLAQQTGVSEGSYVQATKAQNPQKRLIQPQEIGALAAFLCREEARGITMQDLTVSAGSLW